jgi:hypothetical protein
LTKGQKLWYFRYDPSTALGLTVHIDCPELGLDEELEGGGKVVIGLP